MSSNVLRVALLACVASQASALFIGAKSVEPTESSTSLNPSMTAAPKIAAGSSTGVSPLGSASDVFEEGSACRASWIPDVGGAATWKSVTIDLMTGSNMQMTRLGTVASQVDGTNVDVTTFNYTCPQVTPNAAIYFLQYTHDGGKDPAWTTRFAIADANGTLVPPPNANQPQGGSPAIPWGEGALVTAATRVNNITSTTATPTPASKLSGSARQSQLAQAFSSYREESQSSSNDLSSAATSRAVSTVLLSSALAGALLLSAL